MRANCTGVHGIKVEVSSFSISYAVVYRSNVADSPFSRSGWDYPETAFYSIGDLAAQEDVPCKPLCLVGVGCVGSA